MEKIRALIVDDEPIARAGLRTLLAAEPDFEVIGECRNGREAVKAIREQAPSLVFLDVQMPGMSGFDVLAEVGPASLPAVVFVTAYDQYAIKAFETGALDYLLKPFDEERFRKTVERVKRHFEAGDFHGLRERLSALLKRLDGEVSRLEPKYPGRVVVKSAGRIFFVNVDEIDRIEAAGNYVKLHVADKAHLLRETMDAMEARLDPEKFVRIRRSVIVNVEYIRELRPLFKGEYVIILRDGTELTSSRRYRDHLSPLLR
ncbi:MAG TPA: LytTR family DNA-binding domain-containing protein [Blastocatellia bacterium]|nr:LytTR family DNA-binding domain-containing protein [Blastocatellia bacterium]